MISLSRSRRLARAAALLLAGAVALPASAIAQDAGQPLVIHGYLTQGVGQSTQRGIFGLDTAATTDYRSAAVQLRYAMSDDDQFLVQVAHRRLGSSLLNASQADVALDWVFYQREIAGAVVKLGRVPMPKGIYNEVRDVGTLLPFYRAPYNFYTEGIESVDGAVAKYTLGMGAGFSTDINAFAGGWDFRQLSFSTSTGTMYMASSRAQYAYGTQLWLNTPLAGVRLGLGGQRFRFDHYDPTQGVNGARPEHGDLLQASLDATREHYYLRGEWERFRVGGDAFRYPAWYAQGGVKLGSRLGVHAQTDRAQIHQLARVAPTTVVGLDYDYARDDAVGTTFAVTPSFVLKLEGHDARGYNFDSLVNPTAAPAKTRYWLASASVSF